MLHFLPLITRAYKHCHKSSIQLTLICPMAGSPIADPFSSISAKRLCQRQHKCNKSLCDAIAWNVYAWKSSRFEPLNWPSRRRRSLFGTNGYDLESESCRAIKVFCTIEHNLKILEPRRAPVTFVSTTFCPHFVTYGYRSRSEFNTPSSENFQALLSQWVAALAIPEARVA